MMAVAAILDMSPGIEKSSLSSQETLCQKKKDRTHDLQNNPQQKNQKLGNELLGCDFKHFLDHPDRQETSRFVVLSPSKEEAETRSRIKPKPIDKEKVSNAPEAKDLALDHETEQDHKADVTLLGGYFFQSPQMFEKQGTPSFVPEKALAGKADLDVNMDMPQKALNVLEIDQNFSKNDVSQRSQEILSKSTDLADKRVPAQQRDSSKASSLLEGTGKGVLDLSSSGNASSLSKAQIEMHYVNFGGKLHQVQTAPVLAEEPVAKVASKEHKVSKADLLLSSKNQAALEKKQEKSLEEKRRFSGKSAPEGRAKRTPSGLSKNQARLVIESRSAASDMNRFASSLHYEAPSSRVGAEGAPEKSGSYLGNAIRDPRTGDVKVSNAASFPAEQEGLPPSLKENLITQSQSGSKIFHSTLESALSVSGVPDSDTQKVSSTSFSSVGAGIEASPKFMTVAVTAPTSQKAGSLSLKLAPENLGRLEIKVRLTVDGRLEAVVRTEKSEAFELFNRDASALKQVIAEAFNADSEKMSFTLSDENQSQGQGQNQGEAPLNGTHMDYQQRLKRHSQGTKPEHGTDLATLITKQPLDRTRALDALV